MLNGHSAASPAQKCKVSAESSTAAEIIPSRTYSHAKNATKEARPSGANI